MATNGELKRYLEMTPGSRAIFEAGKRYLPGGDTRSSVYWEPYPTVLERGQGFRLWDVDGVERIDFVATMTTLIMGHAHPEVVLALQDQAAKGTAFGAPVEAQYRLGEILCDRIPSLELVVHQLRHRGHTQLHPRRAGLHRPHQDREGGGRLSRHP